MDIGEPYELTAIRPATHRIHRSVEQTSVDATGGKRDDAEPSDGNQRIMEPVLDSSGDTADQASGNVTDRKSSWHVWRVNRRKRKPVAAQLAELLAAVSATRAYVQPIGFCPLLYKTTNPRIIFQKLAVKSKKCHFECQKLMNLLIPHPLHQAFLMDPFDRACTDARMVKLPVGRALGTADSANVGQASPVVHFTCSSLALGSWKEIIRHRWRKG